MTSAANKRLEVSRRLGATERRPVRRLRFGFVLLALGVLWTVQRAPASAQPTPCTGDCNGSGSVTVAELLKGVNIALGTLSLGQCPLCDMNGDNAVTIDEILVAVNNALDGCPTGGLTFDKISLAVFPGGEETVNVTATDADSNPVDWTVASSAPSIASVVKTWAGIDVKGVSLGTAVITVTTQSRLRRTVPVRVYDPMVLDVGDIQIRYIDTFECILGGSGSASYPESFYSPVVPDGWYALGSFRMGEAGCPNVDGEQWMMVVRENPAIWATSFDESLSGDLPSGDLSDPPRALTFAAGNNRVRGSVDGTDDQFDGFSFTLKPGEHLSSVILNHFAGTWGEVRFFAGTDAAADPPALLGQTFMSKDQIGANYLDLLGLDLGPGVYTIAIVASAPQQYEFVLNIGAHPATLPLLTPSGGVYASGYFPSNLSSYHGWQLWAPVCPQGYVGMGTVVTTDPGDGTWPPPVGEAATCVRKDLTVAGQVLATPGDQYFTARIEALPNNDVEETTVYLDTGTMSVVPPAGYANSYPVENVLAVQLPLLIDVPYQDWYPHLTGPKKPPDYSEPLLVKALLVPFTILSGTEYDTRGVGWMVENSPFVRVERVQQWAYWHDLPNLSTTQQSTTYSTETGTDTTKTAEYSLDFGVSVTAEGGVKFLGVGGKISATVSSEFGYSKQTSTTEFTDHTITVPIIAAPCHYQCVWGLASALVVKMLDDHTGQLASVGDMTMNDYYPDEKRTYCFGDYPITGFPPSCP